MASLALPPRTIRRPRRGLRAASVLSLLAMPLLAWSALRFAASEVPAPTSPARQAQLSAAAHAALDRVIDDPSSFQGAGAARQVPVDLDGDGRVDYRVAVDAPACRRMAAAPGYSAAFADFAPRQGEWDLRAVATDADGGSVEVRQSVTAQVLPSVGCA